MNRRTFPRLATVILLALAVLVTGCAQKKQEAIKIGYLAHITGDAAVWGQAEVNGAKMAVEEINQAGGVLGRPLELVVYDGRGNAADSVNAVRRMLDQDKVVAILGSNFSGVNIATAPVVEAAKVPQIGTFSTNPRVTVDENGKVRPFSFRLCFTDPYQGKVTADYAFRKLGKRRAAILYDITSDYSVGYTQYFEEWFQHLGGEVVAKQAFRGGDLDFRPQLSAIKQQNPDILILPLLYKEIALAAKQAHSLGLKVTFMGGDGAADAMLEIAGPELQDSFWVHHFSWQDPGLKELLDKYAAKYGDKNPEPNAGMGYDIVYFLVDCIKRAGKVDSVAIRDAIETAKGVQLKHAVITMDPNTHDPLNKPAVILKPEGDHLVFVERWQPGS